MFYLRSGISRLYLVEHFGNSLDAANINWGRKGVSIDGWKNAIKARSAAAASLNFAGFISYNWDGNQMHDTQANRHAVMDLYAAQMLP